MSLSQNTLMSDPPMSHLFYLDYPSKHITGLVMTLEDSAQMVNLQMQAEQPGQVFLQYPHPKHFILTHKVLLRTTGTHRETTSHNVILRAVQSIPQMEPLFREKHIQILLWQLKAQKQLFNMSLSLTACFCRLYPSGGK